MEKIFPFDGIAAAANIIHNVWNFWCRFLMNDNFSGGGVYKYSWSSLFMTSDTDLCQSFDSANRKTSRQIFLHSRHVVMIDGSPVRNGECNFKIF